MVDVLPTVPRYTSELPCTFSLTVVGRVYHSQLDVSFRSHSVNPKNEPMVGPGVWNSFRCTWKCNNNVNAMTNTFKNLCKQTTFGRNCIYFQDWLLELFNQPQV